jgi:formylglycine-generating enzyme required for sulfatase activity
MRRKQFTRYHRIQIIEANIGALTVSVFLFAFLLFGCNTTKPLSPASQAISQDNTDKATAQIKPDAEERKGIHSAGRKETLGQTEGIWREPITGMEFIRVPGGCYEMGCGSWAGDCDKDSNPAHEVCVDGFFEVTLDQWMKIIKFNRPEIGKAPDHPVENISWDDAKEFIELLNATGNDGSVFRLPTEAEWEYASRSGGKPEKYAGSNEIKAVAWYRENSDKRTHRVGSKGPNGLGIYDMIYDMSGNVREWCEDRYSGTAYRRHQQTNPIYQAEGSFRVIRGGGYKTVAFFCRSTSRFRLNPRDRRSGVGFRIIKTGAKEMNLDSAKIQGRKIGKEIRLDSTENQIHKIGTVKVILGNIRKGPSKKHKIIATVKRGEKVTVIRQENRWYYVRSEHGRMGWCHQSLLKITHK